MATTYYNANQNLKAVGVPVEFTEEQVKAVSYTHLTLPTTPYV